MTSVSGTFLGELDFVLVRGIGTGDPFASVSTPVSQPLGKKLTVPLKRDAFFLSRHI